MPFAGAFYSGLPLRNYLPYGRELLDQGLDAAAVVAFERAAQANPGASTLYRLGALLARTARTAPARSAFERALSLQPRSFQGLLFFREPLRCSCFSSELGQFSGDGH